MQLKRVLSSLTVITALLGSYSALALTPDVSWSGRLAADYSFSAVKPSSSALTHGASLRSADLGLTVDFNNSVSAVIELGFKPDAVSLGLAFIAFEDLFYNTDVMLGQVPTPFCQETGNSGKHLPFFERSLVTSFKACAGPGIYVNHHQDAWAIQFAFRGPTYGHTLTVGDKKEAYSKHFNDHMGGALRVSGAPIMNDDATVHVGFSGSFQSMAKGTTEVPNEVSFKANEVKGRNSADFDIKSKAIDAKHFMAFGAEFSPQYGPFQFESEGIINLVTSRDSSKKNDMYYAFYTGANWIITGQHRTYNVKKGSWGKIDRSNVGPFGVWQVAVRYSHLNMTPTGGDLLLAQNITGNVSFYPTDELRFGVEYVNSMQTKGDRENNYGTLGLRMQLIF